MNLIIGDRSGGSEAKNPTDASLALGCMIVTSVERDAVCLSFPRLHNVLHQKGPNLSRIR